MKYILITFILSIGILTNAQSKNNNFFEVGPGRPPEGWNKNRKSPVDVKLLKQQSNRRTSDNNIKILDVPAFSWTYGCPPTSAGLLVGYYDRNGYPNLYTGEDNFGVFPMTNAIWGSAEGIGDGASGKCPFIASEDHIKDFWVKLNSGEDPFYNKF